jgi:hypothetical protein
MCGFAGFLTSDSSTTEALEFTASLWAVLMFQAWLEEVR